MAINFKLNPRWQTNPDVDRMGRDWVGWDQTLSPEINFDRNRGIWLLGKRAEKERYATFSVGGRVVMAAEIDDIEPIAPRAGDASPKRAIVGHVLGAEHQMYEAFIGRLVDGHRNPVTYLLDPGRETKQCACGCGETVPATRDFAPGHDQRAVHARIARQWGDTVGFIAWFDATYPEDPEPAVRTAA